MFYPVFMDWPDPVEGWLADATTLAQTLGESEAAEMLAVRGAACAMRRLALDDALARLAKLAPASLRARAYRAATQARVLTRLQRFADAKAALDTADAQALTSDDWLLAHLSLAEAEWMLESGQQQAGAALPPALPARFAGVLRRLQPQQLEDRLQALQALGFLAIAARKPLDAHGRLDEARRLLQGLAVWPELVQMNIACASMLTMLGQDEDARALLEEATAIDTAHLGDKWSPLCRLSLARSDMARGEFQQCLQQALQSAAGFARHGNGLGFAAALGFAARTWEARDEAIEAYRILSLGIGIARALKAAAMEQFVVTQMEALKARLGPQAVTRISQALLDQAQGKAPPVATPPH
ncbi:hypothetical protein [Uliginosibacterium sp. H1]|uniref:hypothetical protein n=1 Tax=Uliginosibacterium sp. H1 TaxID=3114757 RepID=UPI002E16EC71|nr:hypothetical protein [Uliginosibacterium sp. H1]